MAKYQGLILALSAVLLAGIFSPEVSNSDFWWHLKTGQYLVENHALPAPDPFAYTTALAHDTYAGEAATRRFNLTHEWLAQAILYEIYRLAGFPGVVFWRALLLAALCGLSGWIAWLRSAGFYRSVAVALAAASVAVDFGVDRPFLFTYLFLAVTLAILEMRRYLWLLAPIFLVWANCHGGFFLGWLAIAVYALRDRRLWLPGGLAVLASGLNPNGFQVLPVLFSYRASPMQAKLLEWAPPELWPPDAFGILLAAAALVLLGARRRVRLSDWLLFGSFAVLGLVAQRNVILIGFLAPILIATYCDWKPRLPALTPYVAAALLAGGLVLGIARGRFFQLHAAEWRYPAGAAAFLQAHPGARRLFNTYEFGGYLTWKLWPGSRVFIDGRALSESLFTDYGRILYDHEDAAAPLLNRYGVDTLVLNGFEYYTGQLYPIILRAGGRPAEWKLVYESPQSLVFMRQPPEGMVVLDSALVLNHLEQECGMHIDREPEYPLCARSLGQVFAKLQDYTRARRWLGVYLEHWREPDPEARQAYRTYLNAGR